MKAGVSKVTKFDPDKFTLTKKDILDIMDAIQSRWTTSKIQAIKNSEYVIALEAFKVSIKFTPEKVISIIWSDILAGFNELIRLNSMNRLVQEYPSFSKMKEIVIQKLKNGELFGQLKPNED